MDLEDEERNKLLRLDDNQIQVGKHALLITKKVMN